MAEATSSSEGTTVGIDLGTTFSCVAVVRNGAVKVIINEQGTFTTPSFVAFNEYERLIGDDAKEQLAENALNTVFDVKRLIGRKFNDPIVQKDMQQWPFKIVEVDGMPKIEITYRGEVKRLSPEEISAMVLGKMKEIAEAYLNTPVKNAVVTVPAYFNDMQRKATKDAGTIAGLNVVRMINEPTAAAIAYGLENDTKIAKNVLVYDLGGGTFDVSILNIRENVYEVKATGGDTHLGGEDFDNILMGNFISEFKRKRNVDITGNEMALRKLRTACERAQRTLSTRTHVPIKIDSLIDGINFESELTRARFDELCADLFRLTIKVVECTAKDANLKCEDIDTVVLVGGSTRIPKIQQLLQDLFKGKEINKTLNPDEAVAYGAAVQGAILCGNASHGMENMILSEVTPLTLGVSARKSGGNLLCMSPIILRNTPIPVSRYKTFHTIDDGQSYLEIRVLQGEYQLANDNFEIGKFTIDGIPVAPARAEKIFIRFSIDVNGILTITAESKTNPTIRSELTVENVCGSLTKAEIERMVVDAEMYRSDGREVKQYHTARWELEEYCNEIKAEHGTSNVAINEKCNEIRAWLKSCFRPKVTQFCQMENELEALVSMPVKRENQTDGDDVNSTTFPKRIKTEFDGIAVNEVKVESSVKAEDYDEDVIIVLPVKTNPVYVIDD